MIIRQDNNLLAECIRECFESDPELLEKWHIEAPASLDQCCKRTMGDIVNFDRDTFRFYAAYEGQNLLGYWGTEHGRYINLIFVKPKFRNKIWMSRFWDAVKDSVGNPFFTAVYTKNFPAICFYSKQGKKITHDATYAVFQFNKEFSCQ